MKFGKIDNFILFGGGEDLYNFALKLKRKKYAVTFFSCYRHLGEKLDKEKLTLKNCLKKSGIKFYISDDVNNDSNVDKYITDSTLGISSSAAWLFKKEFINRFKGRLLNSHGSRLPRYRGGGGPSWRILRNDRLGCSLLHQIRPGYDTGDIVKFKEYIYPDSCIVPKDYDEYTYKMDGLLFEEFLSEVKKNKDFKLIAQAEYLSTYFPRLNTMKQGLINWDWSAEDIELFIRAFDEPYPGASTFIGSKRVFLKDCHLDFNDGKFHPFQTGLVYRKTDQAIFISLGESSLIVKRVLDEDNKNILGDIKLGDRLYTPQKYLEEARMYRAFYDTKGVKNIEKKICQ